MTKEEEYLEIILQVKEWFDTRVKQLQLITGDETNPQIFFEGLDGDKVQLPDELKKGFHFGVQAAIDVFGEFPVKISRPNDSN